MKLTKDQILDFLKENNLMAIATWGDFPWIANVYYSFDNDLNIYFLSDPETLHCKQIKNNNKVAVSIFNSQQNINSLKKGLQLYGIAEQVLDIEKIKHAIKLWKNNLNVTDSEISYENMINKIIDGRMYKITPKRIKLFDQKIFNVKDGQEPVLEF